VIILQATNAGSGSGASSRAALDALAAGYARVGHRVVQVVPGIEERHRSAGGVLRVELPSVPLPGTGGRVIVERGRLRQLLEQWQPDRVEVADRLTLGWLGRWARRRGVPAILRTHERLDVLAARSRPLPSSRAVWDRFNGRLADGFDAVVAPSAWAADEFRRLGARPVHVVPLGVDLAMFHPARRGSGRPADVGGAEVLLAATAPLPTRAETVLLRATLRCLREAGVDADLVAVGDGRCRRAPGPAGRRPPHLRADGVSRADVAALLASADVVLDLGPAEPFGQAALEALACGTPVVGRRTGAVSEVLGDAGRTAYGHPRSLAAAVTALLAEDGVERRAAARAQAEGYAWRTAVDRVLELHAAAPQAVRTTASVP
jgi:alpha-1,6-mannosyltransferase